MKKIFAAALALCLLLCCAVPAMADNDYFQSVLDAYSDRMDNDTWEQDLTADTDISKYVATAYSNRGPVETMRYAVVELNGCPVLLIRYGDVCVDAFTAQGRIFENVGLEGDYNSITPLDTGNLMCRWNGAVSDQFNVWLVSLSPDGVADELDSVYSDFDEPDLYEHNIAVYSDETGSDVENIIAGYGNPVTVDWTPLTVGCRVEDAEVQTINGSGAYIEVTGGSSAELTDDSAVEDIDIGGPEESIPEDQIEEITDDPFADIEDDTAAPDEAPAGAETDPVTDDTPDSAAEVPAGSETDPVIDDTADVTPEPPVEPEPLVPDEIDDASTFPVSGTAGDVTWTLTEDGTLTFSGSGSMGVNGMLPVTAEQVQTNALLQQTTTNVVIEDGVTDITAYAFQGFTSLVTVSIPASVTSIGQNAFDGCTALSVITYAGTQAQWQAVTIADGNTALDSAAVECSDGTLNSTAANNASLPSSAADPVTDTAASGEVIRIDDPNAGALSTPVVYADVLFVLDLSGSMRSNGRLTDMKAAVKDMIDTLATDYPNSTVHYQLITFGSTKNDRTGGVWQSADTFYDSYVAGLSATGDTNYEAPLTAAGSTVWESGYTSIVVFLSDGMPNCHGVTKTVRSNNMSQADFEGALAGVATISCDRLYILGVDLSTSSCGYNNMTPREVLDALAARATGARTKEVTTSDSVNISSYFQGLATNIAYNIDPTDTTTKTTTTDNASTAAALSGSCGDNCTWYLDSSGTLHIQGTGPMKDYELPNAANIAAGTAAPWMAYADSITGVQVESGVTRIGNYAFYGLKNLVSASLADTVASIGRYAFAECTNLSRLSFSITLTAIEEGAFSNCSKLSDIYYSGSQSDWDSISNSFNNNSGFINTGTIDIHVDGHHDAPVTPTPGVVTYSNSPKTGDETPIALYAALSLLLLAAFAGTASMLLRRRGSRR